MTHDVNRETYRRHAADPDRPLLGEIHHLLAPAIGQMRYAAYKGESMAPEQLEGYAERLAVAMHMVDRHLGGDQILGSVGGVLVGDRVSVTGDMVLTGEVVEVVNVEHRAIGGGLTELDVRNEATGEVVRVPMQSLSLIDVEVRVIIAPRAAQ